MKLKIADEKLDELSLKYVIKRNINDSEDGLERTLVIQAIKNTLRAAEQMHQATVDTLLEIIEMQVRFLNKNVLNEDHGFNPTEQSKESLIKHIQDNSWDAISCINETDKMYDDLRGEHE